MSSSDSAGGSLQKHPASGRKNQCAAANLQAALMTDISNFLAVSALVIMTPGPDTAITIRNTLIGGRSAGVATACGIACGQTLWATAASLGAVALLTRCRERACLDCLVPASSSSR